MGQISVAHYFQHPVAEIRRYAAHYVEHPVAYITSNVAHYL
jgi:hypothetical protein